MRHKWTDENGIKHNFCIKCGVKGTFSKRRCLHNNENYKKDLKHSLITDRKNYKGYFSGKCRYCNVDVNYRWSAYALINEEKDQSYFYVPYIEKLKNGIVVKRCYTTNSKYQQEKQRNLGREIKFWKIGCAFDKNEREIRDIIL